jgi:tetratricopeptide (TPR) repeat protein
LHERYLLTLSRLIEAYRAKHDFDAAIRAAKQWMHADSYSEAAHYQLIQLYALSNRVNQARAQFQHYQTIWRNELRLDPSPRILALAAQFQLVAPPPLIQSAAARLSQLEDTLQVQKQLDTRKSAHAPQRHVDALNQQIAQQAQELGLALKKRGTPGNAARHLMRALDALAALPNSPWRREQEWSVRVACDELYDWDANWHAASENLTALEHLANEFGEPSCQAQVHARWAWVKIGQSCHSEAIAHAEHALHISTQHQDWFHAAWAQRLLGVANDQLGDFRAALAHYRAALEIDETCGSPEHLPTDLNNIACVLETMGDFDAAEQEFERARTLLLPQTPLRVKITLQANLGNLWTKLERFDAAARELNQAMEWFKRLGERERECWVGACLARLYQRRGDSERALMLAQHYYLRAQQIPAPQRMAELAAILASLYITQQDAAHALEWAERLNTLAERQNFWRYRVRAAMRLAQVHHLGNDSSRAKEWARRAVALAQEREQSLEEAAELYATAAQCGV